MVNPRDIAGNPEEEEDEEEGEEEEEEEEEGEEEEEEEKCIEVAQLPKPFGPGRRTTINGQSYLCYSYGSSTILCLIIRGSLSFGLK